MVNSKSLVFEVKNTKFRYDDVKVLPCVMDRFAKLSCSRVRRKKKKSSDKRVLQKFSTSRNKHIRLLFPFLQPSRESSGLTH